MRNKATASPFSPVLAVCAGVGMLAVVLVAGGARAHPLAPALLELRELGGGRVEVRWRVSRWRAPGAELRPVLPDACRPLGEPALSLDAAAVVTHWTVACGPGGLVGRRLAVEGLDAAGTEAVVRLALGDGRTPQQLLRPGAAEWVVPPRPRPLDVARGYVVLGVRHILSGLDHLLFVFGLVLLVGGGRRLPGTITAFTAGHSVTLALAALGVVRVPVAPVELAIAASLFVLALDLGRPRARASAFGRRPWAMAGAFGLLHGLGFAAALAEAGLPQGDIPLALASFNVGIELGQLAFVLALLATGRLLGPLCARLPAWVLVPAQRASVQVMGGLAAFWCLERASRIL
jgi:hydrogenase/urease accessory protein HupE